MANNSERELLETLIQKMSESQALNGGIEKLFVMIENVQDKQEETGKKLDKVSDAMYDPDNGLFSRVKNIESKLDTNIDKIKDVPVVKDEIDDLKKFQAMVEGIAGKQLEELNALVKLRKSLLAVYMTLVMSTLTFVGDLIFQYIKHH